MAYIYRILNIITKKCYIGETKSKNVQTRWEQHKRTIENNKGCPALRDAIKKYGIENFNFNVLIICFDNDRFKYEIEYIKKYNTIVPNGYNITKGGEGGGFQGKKHTEKVKNIIKKQLKEKYINNPKLKNEISERNTIIMQNEEIRNKIKNGMKNSEKLKKAIKEKRIGNYKKKSLDKETKNKISESLKKYYVSSINNEINIEKHRKIMAKIKGIKIQQYDKNNNLLNEFESIREASRITNISRTSIGLNLKNKVKNFGEFIWKKSE